MPISLNNQGLASRTTVLARLFLGNLILTSLRDVNLRTDCNNVIFVQLLNFPKHWTDQYRRQSRLYSILCSCLIIREESRNYVVAFIRVGKMITRRTAFPKQGVSNAALNIDILFILFHLRDRWPLSCWWARAVVGAGTATLTWKIVNTIGTGLQETMKGHIVKRAASCTRDISSIFASPFCSLLKISPSISPCA